MKKTAIQALNERLQEELLGLEENQNELEKAARDAGEVYLLGNEEFNVIDILLSSTRDELKAAEEASNKRAAIACILMRHKAYLEKWAGGIPTTNPRKELIELGLSWRKKIVKWIEQKL